jgi:hypothetical protein
LHVYHDQDLAHAQSDALRRLIEVDRARLGQKARLRPSEAKELSARFSIALSSDGSFTFKRDMAKINLAAKHRGYTCLLSGPGQDKAEVLAKFRRKAFIERRFEDLRNHVDAWPSRSHDAETTDGKMFCAFVALIVASEIEARLGERLRRTRLDQAALFREMDKIRVGSGDGAWRLLTPIGKTQRALMAELGLGERDLGDYLAKG